MTNAHEIMRSNMHLHEDGFEQNYYQAILDEYDALKAKAKMFDEFFNRVKNAAFTRESDTLAQRGLRLNTIAIWCIDALELIKSEALCTD